MSSPSLLEKLVDAEGDVDFRHPATVKMQRDIWLPKDDHGLVENIERVLDSYDILHSTMCATIDKRGHVDVIQTEDVPDVPTKGSAEVKGVEVEGDDVEATVPLLLVNYQ